MLVEHIGIVIRHLRDGANISIGFDDILRPEFFLSLARTSIPHSSVPPPDPKKSGKYPPNFLQMNRAQKVQDPICMSFFQRNDGRNRLNEITEPRELDKKHTPCHRTRTRRLPWQAPLPFRQWPGQADQARYNVGRPCIGHHIPCERLQSAHRVTRHW